MTTLRAPMKRTIAVAMMPIGPAPVISTSSPTTSKASAVCTALPSGSRIAAISSAVAGRESGNLAAHLHDLTAVLMSHRHRHGNGLLRPRVPIEDMHVGAADRA